MINDLLYRLNHEWLSKPLPEPLRAIKAAGRDDEARKVNFLVFFAHGKHPMYLIKIARNRSKQEILDSEYNNLVNLQIHENINTKIPKPIGLFKHNEHLVMVETCFSGISLENLLCRGLHRSQTKRNLDLQNVQTWLMQFQKSTTQGEYFFRGSIEIEKRLSRSKVALPTSITHELIELARQCTGLRIPLTAQHGDFWAGNVILQNNSIGVIDWETLRWSSSPFEDLFFFAIAYACSASTEKHILKRFQQAFLLNNYLALDLAHMLRAHIQSIGIPPKFTPLFFIIFLLDLANNWAGLGRMGKNDLPWEDFLTCIKSTQELLMSYESN